MLKLSYGLPVAAVVLDTIVGDPRSVWHPVVLIGRLIGWLDAALRRNEDSPARQKLAGAVLVFIVLAAVYGVVWGLVFVLAQTPWWLAFLGQALVVSFTISPRSLAEAGRELKEYLLTGQLEQARFKVGWIVGRDTANLDVPEITRATVETIAENIVDGIISPLFYCMLGGAPLAFLYRAVNTLDSMLGYKNSKYLHFGMPAARIDDLFNLIPARLTGLLLVVAAWLLGYDGGRAIRMIWRDAARHPSPNSGIPEAAVAGALGVQLGGLNYYGGVPSDRARMGDPLATLGPQHIEKTIRLMYAVTGLFAGIYLLWYYIAG